MRRHLLLLVLFSWLGLVASPALVADQIITRTSAKPVKGIIQKESPKGLRLSGKLIPADDIVDINYDTTITGLDRGPPYRAALASEAKIDSARDRADALSDAIKKYEEALAVLKGSAYKSPRRHIQFKIAYLTALKAREGGSVAPAIDLLKEFRKKHEGSWQITRATMLLAQLMAQKKQYDDAEKVYLELADNSDLSEEARDHYRLLSARVAMRPDNYAAALTKLQAATSKLRGTTQKALAQIYEAECLAGLNKAAEGREKLNTILGSLKKEDKELRGAAHNALGLCYYTEKKYKDALYEFLWVDVIYHQSREEHAKALYYLADLFAKLKDPERAKECRDKLQGKKFAGTEYQGRLASAK